MKIRAISLHEPWATAMVKRSAEGEFLKRIETRSWPLPTHCIGVPIAIAAAKTLEHIKDWNHLVAAADHRDRGGKHRYEMDGALLALAAAGVSKEKDFSPGCVVGVARFQRCRRTEEIVSEVGEVEESLGGYDSCDEFPRFGWETDLMVPLKNPIPAKGAQGFWTWQVPEELHHLIGEAFQL